MRSPILQTTSLHNDLVAKRFGREAKRYNAHTALQVSVAERLSAYLPDMDKPHVLEVGCGTGHLSEHLLRRYPFGDFLFTDLSDAMLTECRLRFPQCGQKRFQRLDGEWPSLDERFDLIVTSMAIHWFEQPLLALSRLRSLLKPGGALFYAALGQNSFVEWRSYCQAQGLPNGILEVPEWPGIIDEDMHKEVSESTLGFFQTMKAMGATSSKAGYEPLSAGTLRKAFNDFDAAHGDGHSWHIVYGKLTA